MKKIALVGYYGFDNAGDEAILAAIISSLRRRIDEELEITVLSASPDKTEELYNASAINRFNLIEVITTFRQADLLLLGGGSLLQDATSQRSLLYYLGLIYLAQKLSLPVIFYAQGVGPITSDLGRALVPKVLNSVDRLTVRDQESKDLLLNLGVKKEVRVTVDPVFNLSTVSKERCEEIITQENLELQSQVIGVSVRYWEEESNNYLSTLAEVLDQINHELKADILFLPLHYPHDLSASRDVRRQMETETKLLEGEYHPREIAGLFEKCDLVVGVRLHSLIFAAVNHIPLVGISYDPKVDNLLHRLNLTPAGRVKDLSASELYNQILDVWQNQNQAEENLRKKVSKMRQISCKDIDLVQNLLLNRSD
ncbi:polysaccharide pyruvyl transferase CsaB [Sporohalobacter salinus]|uniref:polysaccharide pyruvyl transferase CsaB n=1 Tax=Sporohalobacter salinus TaxID=1494606 RepID=UPI001960AEC5|nr:polysaccharide pyruvyl transferase CsaB [Sporohalobacter salinus]MBM7624158.1 polysaccharide pyruvyl transferase CsaB [Sporohalobacter salinus]